MIQQGASSRQMLEPGDRPKLGSAHCELRVGGEDVGDILNNEGLAVPFACGWTSCPKSPGLGVARSRPQLHQLR